MTDEMKLRKRATLTHEPSTSMRVEHLPIMINLGQTLGAQSIFTTGFQPCMKVYVPTCIHLFPHARTDTIQVIEHEPNFSKFYPLTISFLVSQFCTLESSLCVSSSTRTRT